MDDDIDEWNEDATDCDDTPLCVCDLWVNGAKKSIGDVFGIKKILFRINNDMMIAYIFL